MNNSTLCTTADYLAHNVQLKVMLSIRLAISVVGVFLFGLLFKVQGTYLAFHSNARILIVSHHIWVLLQALSNIFCHSFSLIRYSVDFANPCDYLLTMTIASLAKGPTVFSVYGQVWSLGFMAVERCFATYKYRNYEKSTSAIGILLTVAQWLLTTLWISIAFFGLNFHEMKAYPTLSSSKSSGTVSTLVFILGGVETTAISVFFGLLWYNRRKSRQLGNASLTEKYQIGENIRATQLMIPMVITHFCCFMPSLIALPVYMKFIDPTLDQRYYTVYLETVNSSPFYCIFLPVVLFWRHKVLRQNLQRALGLNVTVPDAPRDLQHTRHFQLLKNAWKGPSV